MTDSVLTGYLPRSGTNLRDVFAAWLPQGFARMAQPVAMSTITTDTQGLTAGEVKIETRDGPVPAYRAAPPQERQACPGDDAPRGGRECREAW